MLQILKLIAFSTFISATPMANPENYGVVTGSNEQVVGTLAETPLDCEDTTLGVLVATSTPDTHATSTPDIEILVATVSVTETDCAEPTVVDTSSEDPLPVVILSGNDFCSSVGLSGVIANGTQQRFQTCSTMVQGAIPSFDNMVSTLITSPQNGEEFPIGVEINVVIVSTNIEYGHFDDPSSLYYVNPQALNDQGNIKGHNHISVQKIGNTMDSLFVPDPRTPVFFKGLNDASVTGQLTVDIPESLIVEEGIYRICTSTSSQSHAPVLMPVARRGSSDDCIRITVAN